MFGAGVSGRPFPGVVHHVCQNLRTGGVTERRDCATEHRRDQVRQRDAGRGGDGLQGGDDFPLNGNGKL